MKIAHMLQPFLKTEEKTTVTFEYFGLLDGQTNSLLVAGKHLQCINILREYTMDGIMIKIPSVNRYEKWKNNKLINLKYFYLLRWDPKTENFVRNKNINNTLKEKSIITALKYKYLEKIIFSIEYLRNIRNKNIEYQEVIYLSKKLQAEKFKTNNYPSEDIIKYPYVLEYADYKKIEFKDAADMILFKASIDDGMLAKTEILRIKYFNKIRGANSVKELEKIYADFLLDYDLKI